MTCTVDMYMTVELLRRGAATSYADVDTEAIRAAEKERPDLRGHLVVRRVHAIADAPVWAHDIVHLRALLETEP